MTAEYWQRVKKLLHQAMQLAPAERARFLGEACSGDAALRAELESLLAAQEEVSPSFLEAATPAAGQDATASRLPSKLGRYEILAPIAKGGMGEVYRARDTRLERYVAVKILPADWCPDPTRQSRFEREARATGALNHPNIVSAYDVGRESGISFLVSELIEGESLRDMVARGPVPAARLIGIARQLTAGLHAAHAAGIVHRDLKPENIMVTPEMRVKILDFGLAKYTSPKRSAESRELTAPGMMLGTVGYLSPEQVRGEAVDERSDIFSLGAVLYEMAYGKRAFPGAKPIDILSAILREEPAALRADIPPALNRIIRRCLEKDPQRRFQNAAGVSAALKSAGERPGRQFLVWARWATVAVLLACGAWLAPRWLGRHTPAAQTPQAVAKTAVAVAKEIAVPARSPEPPKADPQPVTQAGEAPPTNPPKPETPAALPTAVVETLAGRPWKFGGEGMPAREVALGRIDDVQCDREGNIYAADWGNNAIVKIDRGGMLHVLAGPDSPVEDRPRAPHFFVIDGAGALTFSQVFVIRKLLPGGHVVPMAGRNTAGFTPDGLPAQGSAIGTVSGMALGGDGSVIFSDFTNQRVRRVDPHGNLQTMAGNGRPGFTGDGGPAQRASLAGPRGLALDRAGNLFIADAQNRCVRKVRPDGQITTAAGHGIAGELGCPTGLAVNHNDDLLIADPCNGRVVMVRGGRMSVIGGKGVIRDEPSGDGGQATAATFDLWSLALDEQENVLVSGPDFGHIYQISRDGTFRIVAGSGLWGTTRDGTPASQALFQEPFGLAVNTAGDIFMGDLAANRIYRIDHKGAVNLVAGYPGVSHFGWEGEDTPARYYRLNGPHAIRVGGHGNLVFADRDNNLVREVTAAGRLRTLAGNRKRSYSGDGGRAIDAALNSPQGVCVDKAGNVYIADTDNHRVRRVGADGRIVTIAGSGVAGYSGDGGPADRAALNSPTALEIDSNGDLYIADTGNHRVRRMSAGVITTLAGDGRATSSGDGGPAAQASLISPGDLALSGRQLFILDRQAHSIRRIELDSGIIATFAGDGESLGDPAGVAVDAAGNVYVTDRESRVLHVVRTVSR